MLSCDLVRLSGLEGRGRGSTNKSEGIFMNNVSTSGEFFGGLNKKKRGDDLTFIIYPFSDD